LLKKHHSLEYINTINKSLLQLFIKEVFLKFVILKFNSRNLKISKIQKCHVSSWLKLQSYTKYQPSISEGEAVRVAKISPRGDGT
jgi:hypothetical protein